MNNNMNVSEETNLNDNLVNELSKKSNFGWVVAFVFFVTTILLILFIALKPEKLYGIDKDGYVVGQVIFEERETRSNDQILADLKNLVVRCVSVSKSTIYEDTSLCLSHMESDLAELRLKDLTENNTTKRIEQLGCINITYTFDNELTGLIKSDRKNRGGIVANLKGTVICNDGETTGQEFFVDIEATLMDKTTARPFALEITKMEDL
jgi:hypothetical protein